MNKKCLVRETCALLKKQANYCEVRKVDDDDDDDGDGDEDNNNNNNNNNNNKAS